CPERHNTKPPIRLNAVGMQSAAETRLAALEEGKSNGLFFVDYAGAFCMVQTVVSETAELEAPKRELLVNRALHQLSSAVPLTFDQGVRPMTSPYAADRFRIIEYGGDDTLLLLDDHNNDNHVLYHSWLARPGFYILAWLYAEKSKILDELDRRQLPILDEESSSDDSDLSDDEVPANNTDDFDFCNSDDSDCSSPSNLLLGQSR